VDPAIIKIIPAETARKYQILPLSRSGATLTIAMADPTNVFAMDDIKFMTGYNVEPVVASEISLDEAIEKYYGSTRSCSSSRISPAARAAATRAGQHGVPQGRPGRARPTFDDMASVGLSEVDLDAMGDAEATSRP
jgi:type IV pilus assembly protein PilB